MTLAILLLATAAGLLALAYWVIRRANPAAATVTLGAARTAPGCEVGQALLMASAASAPTASPPAAAPSGGASSAGAPAKPKRRKPSGPSRRAFLRNSMAVAWLGVLGGFGGATLAFLWPSLRGGFGAQLEAGSEEEILAYIRANRAPYPFPAGRSYLVEYDPALDPDGVYADITNGARVMALYQVCVHLGCKVPWCQSSQWFECPCHGSQYNQVGEVKGGPAPRGMDRFAMEVAGGVFIVDTGQVIEGPPIGTNTTGQEAEGPHCIGGADGGH